MTNSHDDTRAPPAWRRMGELAWQLPRLAYGVGHLGPRGPRDGPPALVIPGFIATDRTTLELRRGLAASGWRVHPWAMGWNLGVKADTVEKIAARLGEIAPEGEPVLLVGWSLGGVFAREVARAHPELVRAVVTLGSPFSGDPHSNNVWRLYEMVAGHKVENTPIARNSAKPPVPTLALWSRADGIVAPASARGERHESDKAVELNCSHMGFGVSRRAVREVMREIDSFVGIAGEIRR